MYTTAGCIQSLEGGRASIMHPLARKWRRSPEGGDCWPGGRDGRTRRTLVIHGGRLMHWVGDTNRFDPGAEISRMSYVDCGVYHI